MALSKATLDALARPGMGMKVVEVDSKYDYDWWNGRLIMWDPPERGASYAVGVDVAEGVGKDRSVIEVLRIGDLKRPDEQVAEFATDYHDPIDLAPIVAELGRFYKGDDGIEAVVIVEANGLGDGVILALNTHLEYGNLFQWKVYDKTSHLETNRLGWWTNRNTRPKLIARGVHAIVKGDLVMNSPFLFNEWKTFQRDHFLARAAAMSNRHDDRVMAVLMAHWAAHDAEWIGGEDVAEQRRRLTAATTLMDTKAEEMAAQIGVRPSKVDYQNRAITWRQMQEEADNDLFGGY